MLRQVVYVSIIIAHLLLNACSLKLFDPLKSSIDKDSSADSAYNIFNDIPPIANAGPDQKVLRGTIVTLDANRSFHPLKHSLSVRWTQTTQESVVTLSNPEGLTTQFIAPKKSSSLIFKIEVLDKETLLKTSDEINIVVTDTLTNNANPLLPILVSLGDVKTTVDKVTNISMSVLNFAPNAKISWKQILGPGVQFTTSENPNLGLAELSFTPLYSGAYIFKTEASIQNIFGSPDYVIVTTSEKENANAGDADKSPSPPENSFSDPPNAPQASIGINNSINTLQVLPKASVEIFPTAAADGLWQQVLGPKIAFLQNGNKLLFTSPNYITTLGFTFYEKTTLRKNPFIQTIEVKNESLAKLVANAGSDTTTSRQSLVTLDASQSSLGDYSNEAILYEWQQILGPQVNLQNAQSKNPSFIAPAIQTTLSFSLKLISIDGESHPSSVIIEIQ